MAKRDTRGGPRQVTTGEGLARLCLALYGDLAPLPAIIAVLMHHNGLLPHTDLAFLVDHSQPLRRTLLSHSEAGQSA